MLVTRNLIELLKDAVEMMKDENKAVEKVLKENGVTPPPTLPDRAVAKAEDIPVGARFMDPEISGAVSINVGQGLVSCSQVIGQCLREDIAMMFSKFHADRLLFGMRLLRLNKEKGWIIPPPMHGATFQIIEMEQLKLFSCFLYAYFSEEYGKMSIVR